MGQKNKKKLIIGTSYFVSKKEAINYYETQETDKETVLQYLKEGAIHIGQPEPKKGGTLAIDHDEGRWKYIEESI